jgi:hypothetical protein
MVAKVGAAPDERHVPATLGFVQDEYDSSLTGAAAELAPGIDRAEQAFEPAKEVTRACRTRHQTPYLLISTSSR